MKSVKKVLLGIALAVSAFAMTAAPAHAAKVGIYIGVGGPVAYIPPSPGPGYAWVDGYWNSGYWYPGYWNYVGMGYGPVVRYNRGYYGDRDDYYRGRDYYRDRDRDRYREHDRDRSWDRDRDHIRR